VNGWVPPTLIEADGGLSVMDCNTGGAVAAATVSTAAELVILPDLAAMFVLPAAAPVAKPALTVATEVKVELQFAVEVRFCVLPSL
jgi:hypothetical protein